MRTLVQRTAVAMFVVLFTSCATLIYKDTTNVNVYTRQKNVKVSFIDTSRYSIAPVSLVVDRLNEPLIVTLRNDSVSRTIAVPVKLNKAFIYGNIFNYTYGLGHLMDLTNYRRYSYPKSIYVDLNSDIQFIENYKTVGVPYHQLKKGIMKKEPFGKGTIGLKLSLPECNSFFLHKETKSGDVFGFFGLAAELDYYYAAGNFVGLGGGGLLSFPIPFPAPFDYYGEYEIATGRYTDLLHGHRIKDLTFSYGLSLTQSIYSKWTTEAVYPEYVENLLFSRQENKLGLSLAAAFNVSNVFSVGVKYLPSFYTLNVNEFRYGHLLFLDLALNFSFAGDK